MYFAMMAPKQIIKDRDTENYGTYCSKIITEVLQQYKLDQNHY